MGLNRFDRSLDEDRLIADHLGFETRRQRAGDFLQTLLHRIGNCNRVLTRLFRDDQRDGWLTIQTRFSARFFRAIFGVTDVAELD